MPSAFAELWAEYAEPEVIEHFAERDENGNYLPVRYRSPGSLNARELQTGIWGQVRFEDVPDPETGQLMRRETRTVDVLRGELDRMGITGFERGAVIEDPSGEGAWELEETTTIWGENFVTFGLVRIPLVRGNELRAAV